MKDSSASSELFLKHFGEMETESVSSHGRLEILGNHTDHNHGLCLVAGADMGIKAQAAKNTLDTVIMASIGYPSFRIDLNDLAKRPSEAGTSQALVRGILFRMKQLGYRIGGFFAACESDIFPGAGVSSSACYESLVVAILSHYYNSDRVTALDMAKIGQFAEREYFGKPCGLLDQIGTSFGGIDYLDFQDPANPLVEPLKWEFPARIVLVNSGGSHANLTPLYASIPNDMFSVAELGFGKKYLREVKPEEFNRRLAQPISGVSELAKMRAQHFFDENARVLMARRAILAHDLDAFFTCVRLSGLSSKTLLQNTMVPGDYPNSPQRALDLSEPYLQHGAARIMGGGFAGSIIAFLLPSDVDGYKKAMAAYYGAKNVVEVSMPEGGPSWAE